MLMEGGERRTEEKEKKEEQEETKYFILKNQIFISSKGCLLSQCFFRTS